MKIVVGFRFDLIKIVRECINECVECECDRYKKKETKEIELTWILSDGFFTHIHKTHDQPNKTKTQKKTIRLKISIESFPIFLFVVCRTCYNANPRPDALMKEQLVEMTGLSPRVIRVWFQNKRCKDKKKTIQMKLQMQQEKDGRKLGYGAMQGIPMVASSPVRHDSPLNLHGLEVTSYQPPWKTLSDFALNADLDNNTMNTHNNPAFQQLYNQVGSMQSPNRSSQFEMTNTVSFPHLVYRCTVTIQVECNQCIITCHLINIMYLQPIRSAIIRTAQIHMSRILKAMKVFRAARNE